MLNIPDEDNFPDYIKEDLEELKIIKRRIRISKRFITDTLMYGMIISQLYIMIHFAIKFW